MAITRPTGDQLRFNSSVNGEIILDAYLEAAETVSYTHLTLPTIWSV